MDKNLSRFKEIQTQTIKEVNNLYRPKKEIKAIGISGSARDQFDTAAEESNSEYLLKKCLDELKKLGAKTELIPFNLAI